MSTDGSYGLCHYHLYWIEILVKCFYTFGFYSLFQAIFPLKWSGDLRSLPNNKMLELLKHTCVFSRSNICIRRTLLNFLSLIKSQLCYSSEIWSAQLSDSQQFLKSTSLNNFLLEIKKLYTKYATKMTSLLIAIATMSMADVFAFSALYFIKRFLVVQYSTICPSSKMLHRAKL